jgi:hypothetical protein
MRCEILRALNIKTAITWDVTSCNLVNVYVSEDPVAAFFRADDHVLDYIASHPRIV